MSKYDELRKLAKYASPGPWTSKQDHVYQARGWELAKTFNLPQDRNAAYVAAASPDVILALLDERELYRTALRSLMEPHSSESIPLSVAALLNATDDEERRPEPWEQEAHIEYSSEAAEEAAP